MTEPSPEDYRRINGHLYPVDDIPTDSELAWERDEDEWLRGGWMTGVVLYSFLITIVAFVLGAVFGRWTS